MQPSLFEDSTRAGASPDRAPQLKPPPRVRREDPTTSKLAAAQVDDFSNEHYAQIREALRRTGAIVGATIYELEQITKQGGAAGLDHVQIARRLPEMAGVYASGETRPGPSGRACRVWRIA